MNIISSKTISIIKSTIPILKEGGETLVKHFYKRMFSNNPEVLDFFNQAHQETGMQQKALLNSIIAYAENIDNINALGDAVELIAHKHVSLTIKPEHYPIVGDNLINSIKEVLGEVATEEVLEAWKEAYWILADILIKREEEIYQSQEKVEGGWRDFKQFTVIKKEQESSVISSFYLKPKDGKQTPSFKAGQYITVKFPSPCGHMTMRNYSLSDKPNSEYFRISVKKELKNDTNKVDGFVSNFLHNNVNVGMNIEIAPPCGNFFLEPNKSEKPLVLLAGGVGITPILSILLTSLEKEKDRKIILIYGNLNSEVQAFKETIDELAKNHSNLKVHYVYSEPKEAIAPNNSSFGFITAELLSRLINNKDADYYFCGPKPFMKSIYKDLKNWNIPNSQINFEFFGPKEEIIS